MAHPIQLRAGATLQAHDRVRGAMRHASLAPSKLPLQRSRRVSTTGQSALDYFAPLTRAPGPPDPDRVLILPRAIPCEVPTIGFQGANVLPVAGLQHGGHGPTNQPTMWPSERVLSTVDTLCPRLTPGA